MTTIEENINLNLEQLTDLFPHLLVELQSPQRIFPVSDCIHRQNYDERTRLSSAFIDAGYPTSDQDDPYHKELLDWMSYQYTWAPKRGVPMELDKTIRHYRSQFRVLEIDVIDGNGEVNHADPKLLEQLRYLRARMDKAHYDNVHKDYRKLAKLILPEDVGVLELPCLYYWSCVVDGIHQDVTDVLKQFTPAIHYFIQKRITSTITNIQSGFHAVQTIDHVYDIAIYDAQKWLVKK